MSNAKKVTVCDSETDPFKFNRFPTPFIWGWYDGENYEEFGKPHRCIGDKSSTEPCPLCMAHAAEFVEFVKDIEQVCYCHNGGKFDFFFLADWIEPLEPLTVINGRLTRFRIGECEFRDSWNILPIPLAKFGGKKEIDYEKLEESVRAQHWKEISNYLYYDCDTLYRAVMRYRTDFGSNLTIAGGAMKVWASMAGVDPPKTSKAFYDEFAPYYYGGRVECFEKGIIERPFTVCDIKSAYPRAMLDKHAFGTTYTMHEHIPADRSMLERSFITLRAESHGAFPWRAPNGSLEFPNDGELRDFHITGWEFIAARDTKTLVLDEVLTVYTFLETVEFGEYVKRFFAEKQAAEELGDKLGRENAKLHLNSLYGKFGANPDKYEEYKTCHPSDVDAMAEAYGYDLCDYFGPHAIMSRPISESRKHFYNVATAASITGWVRAYLWRSINQCKGVLYVDTDSIAAIDVSRLTIGASVGEWSREAECVKAAIGGKKLYAFERSDGTYKVASKGAKLSPDDIFRIARGETINYARDVPTYSINSGVRFVERRIKMTHTSNAALSQ